MSGGKAVLMLDQGGHHHTHSSSKSSSKDKVVNADEQDEDDGIDEIDSGVIEVRRRGGPFFPRSGLFA